MDKDNNKYTYAVCPESSYVSAVLVLMKIIRTFTVD